MCQTLRVDECATAPVGSRLREHGGEVYTLICTTPRLMNRPGTKFLTTVFTPSSPTPPFQWK